MLLRRYHDKPVPSQAPEPAPEPEKAPEKKTSK